MTFAIVDGPGVLPSAFMHELFERSIRETSALARIVSLEKIVDADGRFSEYLHAET